MSASRGAKGWGSGDEAVPAVDEVGGTEASIVAEFHYTHAQDGGTALAVIHGNVYIGPDDRRPQKVSNLPRPRTPSRFVGRLSELERGTAALCQPVAGLGGVGKTRLALEFARATDPGLV